MNWGFNKLCQRLGHIVDKQIETSYPNWVSSVVTSCLFWKPDRCCEWYWWWRLLQSTGKQRTIPPFYRQSELWKIQADKRERDFPTENVASNKDGPAASNIRSIRTLWNTRFKPGESAHTESEISSEPDLITISNRKFVTPNMVSWDKGTPASFVSPWKTIRTTAKTRPEPTNTKTG